MNLTKFLRNSAIVLGVLVLALIAFLVFNFNKSFDFTGGTIANINTTTYTQEQVTKSINDVMKENKISSYTLNFGDADENNIVVLKYQISENVEATNINVEDDLYTIFGYDQDNSVESTYITLIGNVEAPYTSGVFYYALLAVLVLGVACAIYMFLRHNITSGFAMFAQLIIDIGLLFAALLIFRLEISSLTGVAIAATAIISLIMSFITLNNLNAASKEEKYSKTSNFEIAEIVTKNNVKSTFIIAVGLAVCSILVGALSLSNAVFTSLAICLGVVAAFFTSQYITPMLWASSYTRKTKTPKAQKQVNPDNSHV